MKTRKSILIVLIVMTLTFSSCRLRDPIEVVFRSDDGANAADKRFQNAMPTGPTAVESAIEISEKYAEASNELLFLKKQNELLSNENESLKAKLQQTQSEFDKTQKELNEANDLLIETRIELNNWKTSVLGFRDEIREADKAQLQTLYKILQVLGGQIDPNALPQTSSEQATKITEGSTNG